MIRTLPQSHIESLNRIEGGYWWFMGRVYWAMRLLKEIEAERETPFQHYADLGCGVGGFAREIRRDFGFSKIALVDGDPRLGDTLGAEEKPFFLYRDLQKKFSLPFTPDLVTCMDVLEHLQDDAFFLREVNANLADNGVFLISVPNHPTFFSYWDKAVGHYRRYDKGGLLRKLSDAGFEVRSLTPMWSFLLPVLFARKMQSQAKDASEAVFPPVPKWLNRLLIGFSHAEFSMKALVPFGTSLVACCVKR